jgi:NAD(P)-dependent dehydrogenase (short-subunit alcohol dehydrogenase family)
MKPLENQVALIIGGTKGIGRATAQAIVKEGATVVVVGRSKDAGAELVKTLGPSVTFLQADISLMSEVRRVAEEFKKLHSRLDILIHSADVTYFKRHETPEGLETTFATNYLSRFLLNGLLLDMLKASGSARVIHVAAAGLPFKLNLAQIPPKGSSFNGHNLGQAANDLYGLEFAEQLQGTGITVNILNPGMVDTDIRRNSMPRWIAQSVETLFRSQMQTPEAFVEERVLPLALSARFARDSGVLINMKGKAISEALLRYNKKLRQALWQKSERLVNGVLQDKPVQGTLGII